MKVFIGQDDIALLGKGRDARHARKIAGGMHVAGFAPEEGGEFFLELEMVGARAVGGAGPGGGGAPLEHGGATGFDDLGMEGEAEIVVARQHDHVAAIEPDLGAALRLHGEVVGRVLEAHLGRVIVAATRQNRLLVVREEGKRHVDVGRH